MGIEVLIPIFGILLVMIPVAGITVGLLARTFARIRARSTDTDESAGLSARVAQLQEEVESLTAEVRELKAAQDFDRKLLGERAGGGGKGA